MENAVAENTGNFNTRARRRTRLEIWDRDDHTCFWCARRMTLVKATLEHLMPRSIGGPDIPANLVLACTVCNHWRGDLSLTRWVHSGAVSGRISEGTIDALISRIDKSIRSVSEESGHAAFTRYMRDERGRIFSLRTLVARSHSRGRELADFCVPRETYG